METKIKIVGKMDLSKFGVKPEHPTEEIHFFKGKDKKVIGRVTSGKIAIISFNYKGAWVKENDTWLCKIIHEDEKKVIVVPVKLVVSAEENYRISAKLAQEWVNDVGIRREKYNPGSPYKL
jgi:hypothetical protein